MANLIAQSIVPKLPGSGNPQSLLQYLQALSRSQTLEHNAIQLRLNLALVKDGTEAMTAPLVLKSYTVAGAPAPASYTGGMIFVSNESGGATVAYSDGTHWKRVYDAANIS